jgi:hypothetical protein
MNWENNLIEESNESIKISTEYFNEILISQNLSNHK